MFTNVYCSSDNVLRVDNVCQQCYLKKHTLFNDNVPRQCCNKPTLLIECLVNDGTKQQSIWTMFCRMFGDDNVY